MPYSIHKRQNKYCVVKLVGSKIETVPGGCHSTKSKAVKHKTALQIAESKDIVKNIFVIHTIN